MADRHRLLVAIVLEGSHAFEVDGIRLSLGSFEREGIPPHITLVPPVNVSHTEFSAGVARLRAAASAIESFDLALGPVQTFPPRHNVVYLAVGGSTERLRRLRDLVYLDPFIPGPGPETREFVPHVTVTNRADDRLAKAARVAGERFRLPMTCEAITLLERGLEGEGRRWIPVAEFPLGLPFVVGRGGRELSFTATRFADPECASIMNMSDVPGIQPGSNHHPLTRFRGSGLVVAARSSDQIVAVAAGSFVGRTCVLERFVVVPEHRGEGVGRQLVTFIERLARDNDCVELAIVDLAAALAPWFAHLGFSAEPAIARPTANGITMFRQLGSND